MLGENIKNIILFILILLSVNETICATRWLSKDYDTELIGDRAVSFFRSLGEQVAVERGRECTDRFIYVCHAKYMFRQRGSASFDQTWSLERIRKYGEKLFGDSYSLTIKDLVAIRRIFDEHLIWENQQKQRNYERLCARETAKRERGYCSCRRSLRVIVTY